MDVNWYAVGLGATILIALVTGACKGIWKVARWGKEVDGNIANINDKIGNLSRTIDKIYEMFTASLGREVVTRSSPISLSEYGETLSTRVGVASLASRYAECLKEKAASLNAYQIQELCFDYARDHILNDLEQNDTARFNQSSDDVRV